MTVEVIEGVEFAKKYVLAKWVKMRGKRVLSKTFQDLGYPVQKNETLKMFFFEGDCCVAKYRKEFDINDKMNLIVLLKF